MHYWTCLIAGVVFAAGAFAAEPIDFSQTKEGDPLDSLPAGTRLISGFGERPVFSPDGKRIAFIGKSYGDAFEYDIATGHVRNLTAHTAHNGFLRVHYLPDGSFLLLGPRRTGPDRQRMRISHIELWFMDRDAKGPILPLNQHISEGVAVSRQTNRIAWAVLEPEVSNPGDEADEHTAVLTADVVVKDGVPTLTNVRELMRRSFEDCVLEAQDFRDDDREVIVNCYDIGGVRLSEGKFSHIEHSAIWGVRTDTLEVKAYHDIRDGAFNEAEGIAPSGAWTFVDCGPGYGGGLDVCKLDLAGDHELTRVTRFMDYGNHRISNAVVSPDGRWMTYQFGRGGDEAGVGMGILLAPLPKELVGELIENAAGGAPAP